MLLHLNAWKITAIFEPIGAGIIVSLLNKYIISGDLLTKWCNLYTNTNDNECIDEDLFNTDDSNTITAINSDTSNSTTHIHTFF